MLEESADGVGENGGLPVYRGQADVVVAEKVAFLWYSEHHGGIPRKYGPPALKVPP